MKTSLFLTLVLTSAFVISCQSQESKSQGAEKAVSDKASRPPEAKEVNRYEFVESEIIPHPEDEKKFNHLYMGSLDGFDYISVRSNKYKIPSEQLELEHQFSLTEDSAKWVHMRIHFSQVKYQ